jgi:hypothetical protein
MFFAVFLGFPGTRDFPIEPLGFSWPFAGGTLARQKLCDEIDPCQTGHGRLHLRQSKRRSDPIDR